MTTVLDSEWAAFRSALPALLPAHRGQFVLWREAKPLSFHLSYQQAYEAGLDAFGPDVEYLVAEVAPLEPQSISIAWQAGIMFDPRQ